jgi:hypothetical protein
MGRLNLKLSEKHKVAQLPKPKPRQVRTKAKAPGKCRQTAPKPGNVPKVNQAADSLPNRQVLVTEEDNRIKLKISLRNTRQGMLTEREG